MNCILIMLKTLVKPCQSGKTFYMIDQIYESYIQHKDTDKKPIHIVFTDNLQTLSLQTSSRIDLSEKLSIFNEDDKQLSMQLTTDSKNKKEDIQDSILFEESKIIICCTNKTTSKSFTM